MDILVGQLVHVGGATGKITQIQGNEVYVRGVYIYPDDEENPSHSEPWSMLFNKEQFLPDRWVKDREWNMVDMEEKYE